MKDQRAKSRAAWFLLVYVVPTAFWWIRAWPMVSTLGDFGTLVLGPIRLVSTGVSIVPLFALPMMPLFAFRQSVITGILSGTATFAWGFMGMVEVAVPHA